MTGRPLNAEERATAHRILLILSGLFIASLVTCNLIFRKFFTWEFAGLTFEQSVGLLPYPLTFLVTDLISELYGRRKANQVVVAGLIASVFVLGMVLLAQVAPAASWSPVTDQQFTDVFGQTTLAVGASMAAYLLAQFVDVRIFHFWKALTNGRFLWLRNNLSTIPSQFLDTVTVLFLLCAVGEIEWALFGPLLLNGFVFKVLVALADTPLVYLGAWAVRRRFGLKLGEELNL
jgi:uncharacterized integral membrane protein (TIGR00697 family)